MNAIIKFAMLSTPFLIITNSHASCTQGESGYIQGIMVNTFSNPTFTLQDSQTGWIEISKPVTTPAGEAMFSALLLAKSDQLPIVVKYCAEGKASQFDIDPPQ
jgi:hypothetical protein